MRHTILAGLAGRTVIVILAVTAALGGVAAATAGSTSVGPRHVSSLQVGRSAQPCVRVSVSAKPKLNTQAGSTETLSTTLTSCASVFEVIRLKQHLSLRGAFNGTVQLYRHETVHITQKIPFHCCGTFSVIDRAYSASGRKIAAAKASWTFA